MADWTPSTGRLFLVGRILFLICTLPVRDESWWKWQDFTGWIASTANYSVILGFHRKVAANSFSPTLTMIIISWQAAVVNNPLFAFLRMTNTQSLKLFADRLLQLFGASIFHPGRIIVITQSLCWCDFKSCPRSVPGWGDGDGKKVCNGRVQRVNCHINYWPN